MAVAAAALPGGQFIKTKSLSLSYLRSGAPVSRKQLPAHRLLSAPLRGQIGVGGRCQSMHVITLGLGQDRTRVSGLGETEDRPAAACLRGGTPRS